MKITLSKPKDQNAYLESTEWHWPPAMPVATGTRATGLSYYEEETKPAQGHQLLNLSIEFKQAYYVATRANVAWLAAGRQTGMLPATETFATTTRPEAVERYFVFINALMAGFDAPQLDYLRSEISPPFTIPTYLVRDLRLQIQPSAYRLLDSGLSDLCVKVLEIIHEEKQQELPVSQVELSSFVDPEVEDWEELVILVTLECEAEQALSSWSRLSMKRQALEEKLSPLEIRLLRQKIGLHVDWV